MTYLQFKEWATRLLKLWGLYKPHVVECLAMIVAHESLGGKYRKQIGGGPARGIFQMEFITHNSVWDTQDTINKRAKQFGIKRNKDLMETSDEYALFVARHYLLQDPNPIPTDPKAMSVYCKTYWNRGGKATPEEYYRDWELWKSGKL